MAPSAASGPSGEAAQGIRASKPDEIWHIDTTVIRLLDGTHVYLHAVIDNFSRRILSWRLTERFDPGTSAEILVEAGRHAVGRGRRRSWPTPGSRTETPQSTR